MTARTSAGPRVVAVGGGHGLALTLRAVRDYASHTTAIVATGDDGGSSGRIRAAIDMPAPGDLRRCLTTISDDRTLADALEHRFSAGELEGHAVGNLVLAGLVDAGHDLTSAADRLSGWLGIDAHTTRVIPATEVPVAMVAATDNGEVRGQVAVERTHGIHRIAMDPPDPAVPEEALAAIDRAEQVVLAPGSFYTSVLAAAVVPAIRKAIVASDAQVVFVCNLRADEAEVDGYDVARHLRVLVEHGLTPHDVIAQDGALPIGDLDRVDGVDPSRVHVADVDRPHGLAHDATLLGAVLAGLVPPRDRTAY